MKFFYSLKVQLTFFISLLLVLTLATNAFILVHTKSEELKTDIYRNALSFANLTLNRVVEAYNSMFAQENYPAFNTQISEIFKLNQDVKRLQIVAYPLEDNRQEYALIKYDTNFKENEIREKKDQIRITDPVLLAQIRVRYPTVHLARSDTVYAITENGYTDLRGNKIAIFTGAEEVEHLVFPYPDGSHSVVYHVSYDALQSRIGQTTMAVGLVTLLATVIALSVSFILAKRITDPVQKLTAQALQVAKGDFSHGAAIRSHNEIGVLAETFAKMTHDLENYQENLIEKEKINQELQLAGDIQQNLLPKSLPQLPGLDIAAGIKPAVAVGGDVYDFMPLSNGDLLFFIGDVTGHGVPASLIAAISNTLIFTLQSASSSTKEIAEIANQVLYAKTKRDMFVTMILAKWEPESQLIRYTSAGHDQIAHYHAATGKATLEPKGGVALGMLKDASRTFQERTIEMEAGDVILLYSDGIPESLSPERKRFSMSRFLQVVEEAGTLATAQQIYDAILRAVTMHMAQEPQADDITLLVIKRK